MSSKIIVTGASGYLGKLICDFFEKKGFEVVEFSRKPTHSKRFFFEWILGEDVPDRYFNDVYGIIHCAWDMKTSKENESQEINVQGSRKLMAQAHKCGVQKQIFISSMSVANGNNSIYARHKEEVEGIIQELGGCSVRPGLIWGPDSGGMIRSLELIVKFLPIIPYPYSPDSHLYFSNQYELLCCLLKCLSRDDEKKGTQVIKAVYYQSFSFLLVLKKLSLDMQKNPVFVPVPWLWIFYILRFLELLGFHLRLRSDSLYSLMSLREDVTLKPTEDFKTPFLKKQKKYLKR